MYDNWVRDLWPKEVTLELNVRFLTQNEEDLFLFDKKILCPNIYLDVKVI